VKLIVGHQIYLKNGVWPKETGEPLKGILMIDLQYNRYSLMEVKRNKNCVVCGDNGLAQKPVQILTISMRDLHNSTSKLYQAVARKMNVREEQLMLFSQRRNRVTRIEKRQSLRKLRIGARNVMTVVAQNGPDYTEAIVRFS
jgi:uncharacterized protein YigA (DUF484 family)